MENRKKILLSSLLILLSFPLISCRDRQATNDNLSVIFYTGVGTTNVEATHIDPIIVDYGNLVARPEDPTAPGAVFLGWYKEIAYLNEWDFDADIITASTVLYAKWDLPPMSITYVFDEAGGTFLDEPVLAYSVGVSLILPKADRLGSLFLGWILTPVDEYRVGDRIIKTTAGFSEDLVLYALFENKEYTIRFRSLSEEVANPGTHVVEFASEIDFPVLPDTATKTFVGWFSLDGSTTGEWGFQYVNGDLYLGKALSYNSETGQWEFLPQGITVYAKWENK